MSEAANEAMNEAAGSAVGETGGDTMPGKAAVPDTASSPGPDEDPQTHPGGGDSAPDDPSYAPNPGTGDPDAGGGSSGG